MIKRQAIATHYGRLLAKRAAHSTVQQCFVAAASCIVLLFIISIVIVVAGYTGAAQRDAARTPQFTANGSLKLTVGAYHLASKYVDVVFLQPLSPAAPLPPGLNAWPEPGEAVVSPALAKTAGLSQFIGQFGIYKGKQIAVNGLADPTERLVYVRPPTGKSINTNGARETDSFGQTTDLSTSWIGSPVRALPMFMLVAVFALLFGLPAITLLVVALRYGITERRSKLSALRVFKPDWPRTSSQPPH